MVGIFISEKSSPHPLSLCCMSAPPVTFFYVPDARARRYPCLPKEAPAGSSVAPSSMSAFSEKPGAITTSANMPAISSGRGLVNLPVKGDYPRRKRFPGRIPSPGRTPSAGVFPSAAPQGLLCFTITHAVSWNSLTSSKAESVSYMLLRGKLFPLGAGLAFATQCAPSMPPSV